MNRKEVIIAMLQGGEFTHPKLDKNCYAYYNAGYGAPFRIRYASGSDETLPVFWANDWRPYVRWDIVEYVDLLAIAAKMEGCSIVAVTPEIFDEYNEETLL